MYIHPEGGSGAEGSKSWRDGLKYNDARISAAIVYIYRPRDDDDDDYTMYGLGVWFINELVSESAYKYHARASSVLYKTI